MNRWRGKSCHTKKEVTIQKGKQKDNDCLRESFRENAEVKYLIRSKRMAFLQGITDSCFSDPKRFWGYFNRLTKRSSIPKEIELNGLSYSYSKDKASAFNTNFSSVFSTDTSIPSSLPTSPYTDDIVSTQQCSHEEATSALQCLNVSKTPGPDGLHPRMLKECAHELTASLCVLFNKSIRLGRLPDDWKQANITPVFKKGIKTLCERCVLKNLLPELIHVLTPLQHGFIPGRSCLTQLPSVLHDLGSSLDAGDEVDVIYLDFSKAFDSVPHGRLLHKLSLLGIQGSLHA